MGHAKIGAGTLDFGSSFNQNVAFTGSAGVLELAQSQSYTASITGFSTTGGTSLDLRDIGFISAGEATFSGTTTSGVLTVTDGTHTARITLIGDYAASSFTASSDGQGGVFIVDPKSAAPSAPARYAFVEAMAGLSAPTAAAVHAGEDWTSRPPMLGAPRVAMA